VSADLNVILENEQRRKKTQKSAQVSGIATDDQRNQKPWKNQAAKEPQPFSGLKSDRCLRDSQQSRAIRFKVKNNINVAMPSMKIQNIISVAKLFRHFEEISFYMKVLFLWKIEQKMANEFFFRRHLEFSHHFDDCRQCFFNKKR
jgi:hypothetical protein